MAVKCRDCPLRELDHFEKFREDEIAFMERFKVGEMTVEPKAPLLMEGSNSPQLFTVLKGMGIRYKTLSDGRRQVVNFVLPGDFLGLQAGVMEKMGHSVEATTRMTLCVFDRSELFSLVRHNPKRAFSVVWAAAREEHFLGEALTTVGQRSAPQRVAWALVYIFQRCEARGFARGSEVPLPFRQQDLADALGLSLVHTNKTLARLRSLQLATWSNGVLRVNDMEGLAAQAGDVPDPPQVHPLI